MKKIFSFFMALCLVAGAYAMPRMKYEAKKAVPNHTKTRSIKLPVNHVALGRTLPMHEQLTVDPGRHVCLNRFGKLQSAAHPRKLVNGQSYNITSFVEGEACFLGSYYEAAFEVPFAYYWGFDMMGGNGEYVSLEFEGYSKERLAGSYHGVLGYISVAAGDTADVEGTLTIEYKSAGEAGYSPLYTISGQLVDDKGNTYNINADYSFNEDEWEVYDLYAYAICYNSGFTADECNEIVLSLTDMLVTPSGEEVTIKIDNPASKSYYMKEGGWYIYAKDDNWFASVEIYTDELVGSYDSKDLSMAYTTLTTYEDGDTTDVDIFKPLSAVVSENATKDSLFFDVDVLGIEGVTYHVKMFYPMPNITDTVDIIAIGEIYDETKNNVVMFQGQSYDEMMQSDSSYIISGAVYSDKLIGSFTDKESYSGGYYDYIVMITKAKDTVIFIPDHYEMSIEAVSYEGYEGYMITMGIAAYDESDRSNTCFFNVMMGAELYNPYLGEAVVDTAYTFNMAREDVINTQYFEQYGVFFIDAYDENRPCEFYAMVMANTMDPTHLIPLDTYEIIEEETAPGMLASSGYDSEYDEPMPSFFMTRSNIWYMVEGTMTMAADKMTVAALNSNGNKVNITINFTGTGLKDMMQEARISKMMHNGRLYIMRGDKMFDVIGNRMK